MPAPAAPAKFAFDQITTDQDRGPQLFCLYGPPKTGKTTLLCDIPRLFMICPEEGLKGVDRPAPHFPRAPRNLVELHEALDVFAASNVGKDRPFYHLGIDSLSWIADMFAITARADQRTRNLDADFKSAWGMVSTLWDELFQKLAAVRRRCGVHVWLVAHAEQRQDSNADGDTWPKWDLQLEKKAAALVRRSVDHVFFMNFAARLQKGGKGKRAVGQYTGRVLYTRDSADHFAGSRSSVPAEIPAEARRLLDALASGQPAPEAKLRKELDELLEQLPEEEAARFAAAAKEAANARALSRVLAEAQAVLATLGADDDEESPPPPVQPVQPAAPAARTQAPAEEDPPADDEESPPPPVQAAAPAPKPAAQQEAPAPSQVSAPPVESELARGRMIVNNANTAAEIGKAFVALSKLPGLTGEQRTALADQLRDKKAALP